MKIIIAGAYDIGAYLAQFLSRDNHDIVLIDKNEERLAAVSSDYDLMTINASPTSIDTLKKAGVTSADLVIAVTPDQNVNTTCCMIAKKLGAKRTVAKIDDYENMQGDNPELFRSLGVDSLIYPEQLAAKAIAQGLKLSWARQRWDVHSGELVMLGIKLREECEILNRPLKELCGPNDPYHVLAIKRNGETIIPNGNDELKYLDFAYFMTLREYVAYIRKIVGKEHYVDVKDVMVMGGGTTAARAMSMMPSYMDVKLIERDEQRCQELNEILNNDKVMVVNGDGRDMSLLMEENIKAHQAFVALTGNAEANILACLAAKKKGVRKTVALIENLDYMDVVTELDIGTIVNKKALAASHIYQMLLDGDVNNVTFLMSANIDVAEFTAQPGSKVTRKKVYELNLPYGTTIGGLVRNGKGQLVSGGTQIQADDTVVVICHNVKLNKVEKFFRD